MRNGERFPSHYQECLHFYNRMHKKMSHTSIKHLDLQRNGPLSAPAKSWPSTRVFPLNSTIVNNKCLKMDFWFAAIAPAVFGWVLFSRFILVFLRLLDARKFKVNRTWRQKPPARNHRQTQAAAEHVWDLWDRLRIYCFKSGLHVSFMRLQELLFFKYRAL